MPIDVDMLAMAYVDAQLMLHITHMAPYTIQFIIIEFITLYITCIIIIMMSYMMFTTQLVLFSMIVVIMGSIVAVI